jgi:hypothetical protein
MEAHPRRESDIMDAGYAAALTIIKLSELPPFSIGNPPPILS